MKKIFKLLSLAVVLALAVCLLCACNNEKQPDTENDPAVASQAPTIDNSHATAFATSYGDVLYPSELKDEVRIEESDGSDYSVSFYATINDTECLLYKVNYGIAEGFKVGTLKTDAGDIDVYGYINDIEFDDTWTQEDIDSFCAMQESINNVLQSIREYPNFSE